MIKISQAAHFSFSCKKPAAGGRKAVKRLLPLTDVETSHSWPEIVRGILGMVDLCIKLFFSSEKLLGNLEILTPHSRLVAFKLKH
jgi:hypothetical protein